MRQPLPPLGRSSPANSSSAKPPRASKTRGTKRGREERRQEGRAESFEEGSVEGKEEGAKEMFGRMDEEGGARGQGRLSCPLAKGCPDICI